MRKLLLILNAFLFMSISCSTEQKSEKLVSFTGITIGLPLADSLQSKYKLEFVSSDGTFVGPIAVTCDSIYKYGPINNLKGLNGKWILLDGNFYAHPKDGRIYKIYGMANYDGYELLELFKEKYGNPIDLRDGYNFDYIQFSSMDGVWELHDDYNTVLLYKLGDSHIIPGTGGINRKMYFIYLSQDLLKDVKEYSNQKEIFSKMKSGKIKEEQKQREEALLQDF